MLSKAVVRCQNLMRDCCGSRLSVDLAIPDVLFQWPRQHQAENFRCVDQVVIRDVKDE